MEKRKYKEQKTAIDRSKQLEELIADIFHLSGYQVQREVSDGNEHRYIADLTAKSGENYYCIEASNVPRVVESIEKFRRTITRVRDFANRNSMNPVLIISGIFTDEAVAQGKEAGITLIDIRDLLNAVPNNTKEYDLLRSLVPFQVDNLPERDCPIPLGWLLHQDEDETLISQLKRCPSGKADFAEFEGICTSILKRLFSDDLALWDQQCNSNDQLYRFDLLCRVKNNNRSTFWGIIERFFNSKYVIFEYKNYEDKITQKEIYTTERYLYLKALRSVAIVIARKGADDHAYIAAKGTLRENGKLILILDEDDLYKMIDIKRREEDPSEYLLSKLDHLLSQLEK